MFLRASLTPTAALLACMLLAWGCDARSADRAARPATRASATAPATTAPVSGPATQPHRPDVVLNIGGEDVSFPPARLQLTQGTDAVIVLLYGEDTAALDDAGNDYYLQMPLDTDDPQQVGRAQWRYKAPGAERTDDPNGISLGGGTKQLQPYDVTISFQGDGPPFSVRVEGDFLEWDSSAGPDAKPRIVAVSGVLAAEMESSGD